jgi:hypothetical protein
MRYERNLQVQLRERYRQLFKVGFVTYKREMEYFRKFILSVPALSAIVYTIQWSEPDLDPDKWYREKFQFRDYDFPESEIGRAKFVWRIIERIASGELDALQVVHFFPDRPSNHNESIRLVTERMIEPFVNFLEYRIGTESDILYLLDKVKRRIEFFDEERLYTQCMDSKGHREKVYDDYIRQFLFDQGVDYPFSQPHSASGEADIVSGLETDDPLVSEIKLYDGDGYGVPYLKKGFNQAVQYAQDYGKTSAYFLIMNLSDQNLHMPSDEDIQIWPPRLHTAGVTVYIVVVRAKPLPSASNRSKQATKQVSRDDLIRN